ncbi:MAG: M48 family metallopeptidase [Verrucomicrobia bacterium]|nr:M48 family metallopeptidase [Verrucomicrobiota bacterium]
MKSAYGDGSSQSYGSQRSPFSGCSGRLVIIMLIAAFAVIRYLSTPAEVNHFTGRKQHLDLDPPAEIQMGLASRAEMAAQHGGLSPDASARDHVNRIGQKIVRSTDVARTPYQFDFHLLADRQVVNAFALPGGQVFMTEALYRMLGSEDEIAGVLGHEIGHVVGRHSSEQIAKGNLFNGITNAIVIGASGSQGGYDAARAAQMVNQIITLKYSRSDESEADKLGVRFLIESGYNPEALIRVMEVLKKASGGSHQPEIMSTHPDPGNRAEDIRAEIDKYRAQSR